MVENACCLPRGTPPPNVKAPDISTRADFSDELAYLPGGRFLMGSNDSDAREEDGETPVYEAFVEPFHIAATAVTNAQFAAFVNATNYQTQAEEYGWSYVFREFLTPKKRRKLQHRSEVKPVPWWIAVKGAYWKKPEGQGSTVAHRQNHPVVHISWYDAIAFCTWAGCRLPTETEWEFAARGGLVGNRFPWGNELTPQGVHQCNIWQGKFPSLNTLDDGYLATAPVDSFNPNGFGLYNMAGNVWEWCIDLFSARTSLKSNPSHVRNDRVLKGGSYLCHASYCNRYRIAARYANEPGSATGNCGFRCAGDA